jgi:hypothetical protein
MHVCYFPCASVVCKETVVVNEQSYFVIGSIMFHVRRRPPDYHPRKRKKKPGRRADEEDLGKWLQRKL